MATEKSFQLYINKDNVKHYFTASGGVLNGAQISTKYITMRTSSTTARFTMNDAGRDVLFPSAAAIAHKVDVWAQAIATLNNSKNTINVAIAGQNAITTERIHTSLNEYTGSVSGSFTKSNTSAVYTIKILNSFHAAGVRDTSITAYFTQYSCAANKSGNGVKSVSVSNAAPYEGETVTFSAELYNGANFDGWYSDKSCTQLVSSSLTYSTTAADLTLYAKATIDATLYNVSAVAGLEITSVSVSDSIVPDGDMVTFTAQVNENCSFEAWYSDNTYTTVVSTENPYTATITADTTLYAKAHISSLNISVGTAEHGTASVSATTVLYGDDVTFTFTPEDETWELYGWYADEGLTQLISEENPYTCAPTTDYKLYPKIGFKRYEITLTKVMDPILYVTFTLKILSVYYDQLTSLEKRYIKTGEFDKIDQSKIYEDVKSNSSIPLIKNLTVSAKVPINTTCILWVGTNMGMGLIYSNLTMDDASMVSNWPYCIFTPTQDATYYADYAKYKCICSAIGKNGIAYADATTPTRRNYEAEFTAELENGYQFKGWYSDEACTNLISIDNPARIKTPTSDEADTSLTLYATAIKATYTIRVGTADHCTTSVSSATAQYGDTVTFNCMVDEGYEFIGWYSDEGLTQLVSEDNPYAHSMTDNVVLYPKIEKKQYTISIGRDKDILNGNYFQIDIAVLYYDQLTRTEINYLRTGEYNKIDTSKILLQDSVSGNNIDTSVFKTIKCPYDAYVAVYAPPERFLTDYVYSWFIKDGDAVTRWPYYWFQPIKDTKITTAEALESRFCHCSATPKEGISYAYATTPTLQEYDAIFEAEVAPGYTFSGWYSNEACTTLVSTDNPAYVTAPKYTTSKPTTTYLTLYAKATPLSSTTGIYLKRNGSWIKAKSVFKKTNGTWVEQEDLSDIFSGESSGTASNYVYGGNV